MTAHFSSFQFSIFNFQFSIPIHMKLRSLSRLAVRLLAFNAVLVFLPIAGVLFLGQYEETLETAEIRDLTHRSQLIAAAIARQGTLDADAFEDVIRRAKINDLRVRLIDSR